MLKKNLEKISTGLSLLKKFFKKVRRPLTGHYGTDALDGGLEKLETLILNVIPAFATAWLIYTAFDGYTGSLREMFEYWPELLSLIIASFMLFGMCVRLALMSLAMWQALTKRRVMWHAFVAVPGTIAFQGFIVLIAISNPELGWLLTPANLWVSV